MPRAFSRASTDASAAVAGAATAAAVHSRAVMGRRDSVGIMVGSGWMEWRIVAGVTHGVHAGDSGQRL